MSFGPRTLRTRLWVTLGGIAVGVLVVTGITTLALARRGTVRQAETTLQAKAPKVADQLEALGRGLRARRSQGLRTPGLSALLATVLDTSNGGIVTVKPNGQIVEGLVGLGDATAVGGVVHLPEGVDTGDLDAAALADGNEQTGRNGDLVFVAQPLTATRTGTPVLVLTQQIETSVATRGRGFFLLGSALAVLLAMVVAFYFARRLTRPLQVMGTTAQRIASGDLTARVDLGRHPDDELARLATTMNGMAAQLEESRGRERNFILSVSHDLRTPLTAIRGYAEALTDGTIPATDEQRRAGSVISAEAQRLERLVADLLDLARLDAHQFSLHARPIDAADLVRTTVEGFRPSAAEVSVSIATAIPDHLAADLDPDRLGQVVANLVENALKYAHRSIAVSLEPQDGWLVLTVADDGPGIPEPDLDRVFERLYISRSVQGRSVGTGLGLAIVRELAAAMGGDARAASSEGGGASFLVRLPSARTWATPTVNEPAAPRR